MNGTALELKEHIEQKGMVDSYGRYDIVYVMLDKSIDHLKAEVKDLRDEMRSEFKNVRGEVQEVK